MKPVQRWLCVLAVCALVPSAGLARAAGDPAKELAALEEEFETSPESKETLAAFRTRYEALARSYPGTEQALTAKLRLLEFTQGLGNEARAAESARIVDEILAQHPRSEQLARIPELWMVFSKEKCDQVLQALSAPEMPDRVKAALLLNDANGLRLAKQTDRARTCLEEIAKKYRDVPYRWSTYGAVADALLEPHPSAALAPGSPAPEIEGKDVDGRTIKLSELKGRVVVLDFFGDW